MTKGIGTASTFWSFACVLVLVMTYAVFVIPETKGKSLEEIQQYFRGVTSAADDDNVPMIDDDIEETIEAEVNAEISTTIQHHDSRINE